MPPLLDNVHLRLHVDVISKPGSQTPIPYAVWVSHHDSPGTKRGPKKALVVAKKITRPPQIAGPGPGSGGAEWASVRPPQKKNKAVEARPVSATGLSHNMDIKQARRQSNPKPPTLRILQPEAVLGQTQTRLRLAPGWDLLIPPITKRRVLVPLIHVTTPFGQTNPDLTFPEKKVTFCRLEL